MPFFRFPQRTVFSFFTPKSGRNERLERLLQEAAEARMPPAGLQRKVKARLFARLEAPALLRDALKHVHPTDSVQERLKARLLARITPAGLDVWDRLRHSLTPPPHLRGRLWDSLVRRLEPVPASGMPRLIRWTAAFALVLLAARLSPVLFVAVPSRADSSVLLVPTRGEVSVLVGGLWQPVTREIALAGSVRIRTGEGAATVISHDDGVLRLAPRTILILHDTSDRPAFAPDTPTFSLSSGTLWVQGLLPENVGPGWTVDLGNGELLLRQGSVSLERTAGGEVTVEVWDRLARLRASQDILLTAGEGVLLADDRLSQVRQLSDDEEEEEWVEENLARDAVHRREIALLQQERRARHAGILPTSTLYPVKRVAEAVDVLFTFGEEAKVQKRLQHATTRLDEAAALLQESGSGGGSAAAERSLREYRDTLLSLATGSGQDVSMLVARQLLSEASETAAAQPDDESYLLKKTVLETTAELPGSTLKSADVQAAMLVDALAMLTRQARGGDVAGAAEEFKALAPSVPLTEDASSLSREMRKEATAALTFFAVAMKEEGERSAGTGGVLAELSPYLPPEEKTAPVIRSLSDAEVDAFVQQMYDRIFTYKLPRSRYNQLLAEFRSIEGHPDQGRILRRLYRILPENGLARYVRTEFQKVRERVEDEG